MAEATGVERRGARIEEQGLLFEYTIKVLVLAAFFELLLYRLVSRLGMHLSKLAQQYDSVRLTLKGLSSIGFMLLNVVSILAFLAIFLVLFNKRRGVGTGTFDRVLVPAVSLLVAVTIGFLVFPPDMAGMVVYNGLTVLLLVVLLAEFLSAPHSLGQRALIITYVLGICGWLYYQGISTLYGLAGWAAVPPLAHEVSRIGEALMVLASMLVLWAYGGLSLRTSNRRQQRRIAIFGAVAGVIFVALLFVDYFLGLYDPRMAEAVRKGSQGIGWIFQMGMGYTFYLPFALYMAGLLCWSYTVIKLISMGRPAGFGLALMFMAGYALQLSHLTLMVILGLLLITLERRGPLVGVQETLSRRPLASSAEPVFGEQA